MWLRDYHVDGLRLDAVHAIVDTSAVHLLEQLAAEVAGARAPARPAARGDRRERPQRPAPGPPGGDGRLRPRRAVERRLPPRAARALTGERTATTRTSAPLADLADALERAYVYDGRYSAHRDRRHGRPADRRARRTASSATSRTTTRSATGPWASAPAHLVSLGQLEDRRRAGAAVAVRADAVPGRGVGRVHAVPVLHRPQDPELGRAVTEGPPREFAAFGWDPRTCPTRRTRRPSSARSSTGPSCDKEPHAEMLDLAPPAARPPPAPPRPLRR